MDRYLVETWLHEFAKARATCLLIVEKPQPASSVEKCIGSLISFFHQSSNSKIKPIIIYAVDNGLFVSRNRISSFILRISFLFCSNIFGYICIAGILCWIEMQCIIDKAQSKPSHKEKEDICSWSTYL